MQTNLFIHPYIVQLVSMEYIRAGDHNPRAKTWKYSNLYIPQALQSSRTAPEKNPSRKGGSAHVPV